MLFIENQLIKIIFTFLLSAVSTFQNKGIHNSVVLGKTNSYAVSTFQNKGIHNTTLMTVND